MNENEDFLDVTGAAKYLKVSTKTIYDLRATNKEFPSHNIGKKVIFFKEELKKWVLEH